MTEGNPGTTETGQDRERDPHQETEAFTNRQETGTTIDHQETKTTTGHQETETHEVEAANLTEAPDTIKTDRQAETGHLIVTLCECNSVH